jgi:AcrR family transcriptional regulator
VKAGPGKTALSPATAKPPTKVRTPNSERSAATRAKILNATIDCLADVGYHHTSTVLVTERAKVSRGAMLHHFPSKAELILATFDLIRSRRTVAHNADLALMKSDRDRFLHLIDALWRTFKTPTGVARLEIMIGARCDPEVGPAVGQQHHQYLDEHFGRVHGLAQSLGFREQTKIDAFVMLYVAAIRGLMMESFYPAPQSTTKISAAIALMKDIQLKLLDELPKGE